jgi:hypothetical protein
MSKQDGYSSRTAADLERKYNFGKTFAEVYDLVSEAQRAAKEAQNAFDGLNQEQIFNLLTNYGESQGIYRDDNGDVYVNASYIKGGTIKGDSVKVEAATITGQLVATQIDTKDLKVLAANITGTLTAGQIDTTFLTVSAANVTGKLTASQINVGTLRIGDLNDDVGLVTSGNVTTITQNAISTAYISADQITSGTIEAANVELDGLFDIYNGNTYCGAIGGSYTLANGAGATMAGPGYNAGYVRASGEGAKVAVGSYEVGVYYSGSSGGCYSTHTISVNSDRRLKNNINYELEDEEKLFPLLQACSFEMNNEPGKKRWGFIAQDFIASAEEAGMDTGKLAIIGERDGMYSIAYGEMTALNTHMIQKLMNRVSELEGKIA